MNKSFSFNKITRCAYQPFLLVLIIAIWSFGNNSAVTSGLLKYVGATGILSDIEFRSLCADIVPQNWLDDVFQTFSAGDKTELTDNRYLTTSGCQSGNCGEKVFFWYDLTKHHGVIVRTSGTGTTATCTILSKTLDRVNIPASFFSSFAIWAKNFQINSHNYEYCTADVLDVVKMQRLHTEAIKLYKAGKPNDAVNVLRPILDTGEVCITIDNVDIINDYAFFLEQAGEYKTATNILDKIVAPYAFPNRTVAYLNLADAYAGLGDSVKAKANYSKYADMMKTSGKQSKIPKRVSQYIGR
jgi:hypothetical protein